MYTDDLLIGSKDPKKIMDTLENVHGFKLKGVEPLTYHFGCDYTRDPDGTLVCELRQYIEKMIGTYKQMFGEKSRAYSSPLERNDHPKLDDSQEMEGDDVRKYQSMVGALQWAIALGRFEVLTPTMTMSSFRVPSCWAP